MENAVRGRFSSLSPLTFGCFGFRYRGPVNTNKNKPNYYLQMFKCEKKKIEKKKKTKNYET